MWPILFVATFAGRCVDATGSGMVRAGESGTMATNKKKNAPAHAPAFTTAWAHWSNVARYIAQHLSPYHAGARLSGRRYIPKCLHLAPNSWRHKQRDAVSNIGGPHLAPPGRHKQQRTVGYIGTAHLTPARYHQRRGRVSVTNSSHTVSVTNSGSG